MYLLASDREIKWLNTVNSHPGPILAPSYKTDVELFRPVNVPGMSRKHILDDAGFFSVIDDDQVSALRCAYTVRAIPGFFIGVHFVTTACTSVEVIT